MFAENKFLRLRFTFPLIVFLLLVLVFVSNLGNDPSKVPSVYLNKHLPSFQSYKLDSELKETISSKSLLGEVWILNVWASWCQPCLIEHPQITFLANNDLTIVGLNYKDEDTKAINWLAKHGNPFRYSLVDKDGKIGIELGVYGVPESFLIDQDGKVIYKHIGPLLPNDAKLLLDKAKALL